MEIADLVQKKTDKEDFKKLENLEEIEGIYWFEDLSPEYSKLRKYDTSEFSYDPETKQVFTSAFSAFERYLRAPAIVDHFENHDARREWRKTLDKKTRELYETNRLRRGKISNVLGFMELAADVLNDDPRATAIETIMERLKKQLPDTDQNISVEFADKVSRGAINVTTMFS